MPELSTGGWHGDFSFPTNLWVTWGYITMLLLFKFLMFNTSAWYISLGVHPKKSAWATLRDWIKNLSSRNYHRSGSGGSRTKLVQPYDSLVHMFINKLRLKCPDLFTYARSVTRASYVPSSSKLWMDDPRVSAVDLANYLLCVPWVSLAPRGLCTYWFLRPHGLSSQESSDTFLSFPWRRIRIIVPIL